MLSLPKNIENICRLCLTESEDGSDMLPLFPVRGGNPYAPNTVVSKILQATTVKIEHHQGAPTTICEFCNARIDDWHSFKEQCLGTDEYLKATYRHIFSPDEMQAAEEATAQFQPLRVQPKRNSGYQQVQQEQQQHQQYDVQQEQELLEEMTELPMNDEEGVGEEDEGYLLGEEITPEEMMMQQQDQVDDDQQQYYQQSYQDFDEYEQNDSLVQEMNQRSGIRVPKWSKEFGAKLNSLLHVVGGERAHQCKVCRKRFLRRPHCRRHVAHAHAAVVDSVKLPKNWHLTARRRFVFANAPIQPVLHPVPPSPPQREDHYEPTPERPHQCEVCKKCFKRSQHLRRHKTSHLQIEIDRSEIMRGIQAQQKAQHKAELQLQQLTNHHPTAPSSRSSVSNGPPEQEDEDDDVIALSDDEDMGEEISPEEFNGLSQFDGTSDAAPVSKRPRLSDIPHIYYGSGDDEPQFTKNGTLRKRAPPLQKLPGERPYMCKLCHKTFKRGDHLKSHMKTHSTETDFSCDWCQRGFRYKQNYLIHMRNRICLGGRLRGKLSSVAPSKVMKDGAKKKTNAAESEEEEDEEEVLLGD